MPPPAAPRRRHPKDAPLRRAWCCSFGVVPPSPDLAPTSKPPKAPLPSIPSSPSFKPPRGLIDPRRILSPGRVSPIPLEIAEKKEVEVEVVERGRDLRLGLKGRDGRGVVLELDPEVLCRSSPFFDRLVGEARRGGVECRKIEVGNIADLGVFKDAVEMMYLEGDLEGVLVRAGAFRAVDLLEVSSTIMFERGVNACLKYLEAVPWTESEEEKLKSLFLRCPFDESITQDILARLYSQGRSQPESLALRLIQSVASGTIPSAKKEMQSLVNSLLSKSSVYEKDPAGFNKEGLYSICCSCLNSLVDLFEEASGVVPVGQVENLKDARPLIERVSKQVENLIWLLDILTDKQLGEDFVGLWADQAELVRMHETTSPMIRYELSRISAYVFISLGKGKLQCGGDIRYKVVLTWFRPMLLDFGWLQRCSKGLDMRTVEEGLGQALLTLSLKNQESLFIDWFKCFACRGSECPNLSKAFQVWWRRSFVRPTETQNQVSRDYRNLLYEEL